MRIIEGFYEMQQAQKIVKPSSRAILQARSPHMLDLALLRSPLLNLYQFQLI